MAADGDPEGPHAWKVYQEGTRPVNGRSQLLNSALAGHVEMKLRLLLLGWLDFEYFADFGGSADSDGSLV